MTNEDPRIHSGEKPTCYRYAVLVWLCSLAFITYLDRICIMRVQNEISNDLRFETLTEAQESQLQSLPPEQQTARREEIGKENVKERMAWVFSAFLVGYVLFEIPGGWLGDVWGSRGVITRIVIWWSIFTVLTGSIDRVITYMVADPSPLLLLGGMVAVRFLFGLGEAGAYPNISRVLGRWFPYKDRAAAQGVIWMCSRLGGALSPLIIGTLMYRSGGWRQSFWILGAVGIVWAIAFWFWFRNRPEDMPGVNAAECALIRSESGSAGAIYADHGHAHGEAPWGQLLTSTNLWAMYLAAASVSFCWYFYVTFLPKYLEEVFHVKFADSELRSGLPLLVGAASCLAGGKLSDILIRVTGSRRWGRSLIGIVGFSVAGLCLLLLPLAGTANQAIAIICLACIFQDLAVPVIWTLPADVGGRYAGTIAGAINAVGAAAGVLSPYVSARFSTGGDWSPVFYLFAGVYLFGALCWIRIDASRPVQAED